LLGLLKEVVPALTQVAVMFNPDSAPQSKFFMQAIEAPARSLGARPIAMPVRATADIEPALASFARAIVEGNSLQLRYPIGAEAVPLINWRASKKDEEIVALGAGSGEDYKARMKHDFGLDVNL
jgi:hypothetical protein